MEMVINLLLFYSKILVVLLLFQQISNQPIKPLWYIITHFCTFYFSSYALLLGTLHTFLSLSLITYIGIGIKVKYLIFFMACILLL